MLLTAVFVLQSERNWRRRGNLRDPNFLRLLEHIFIKIHSAAQNMQHIHIQYSLRKYIYVYISSVIKVWEMQIKTGRTRFYQSTVRNILYPIMCVNKAVNLPRSSLMNDLGGRSFHTQS